MNWDSRNNQGQLLRLKSPWQADCFRSDVIYGKGMNGDGPVNGLLGKRLGILSRGRKPCNLLSFNQGDRGKLIASVVLARFDSRGGRGVLLLDH
jgi:hypothetical protein